MRATFDRIVETFARRRVVGAEAPARKRDAHGRSIAKAITWRIWGTLDTSVIAWFVTGSFAVAISIGSLELFVGAFGYYFHERIWSMVHWGSGGPKS